MINIKANDEETLIEIIDVIAEKRVSKKRTFILSHVFLPHECKSVVRLWRSALVFEL